MENKKKTAWLPLLPAGTAGVLLAALGRGAGGEELLFGFGRWLRALSLGSGLGNIGAWAIVLALTALPLVFLFLVRRKGGWVREDGLLGLLAVLLFLLCYFGANPSLLGRPAGDFFPLACGGAALSAAAAWFVFQILRALEAAETERLAAAGRVLLTGCAVLVAFSAGYTQMAALLNRWDAVVEGNTAGGYGPTLFMLAVLAILTAIPDLLAALTLLWGGELAAMLGSLTFERETVALCGRIARGCRSVTGAAMAIAVGTNLLQLALLGVLRSTYFSVVIPLFPLVLSAALYLLCRCLQRGRELQDDSDSII